MKRYLVTGGAGFIGSQLINALMADASIEVFCIDNYDPFYSRQLKYMNICNWLKCRRFHFYEMNISEVSVEQLLSLFPDRLDAIIHLAAKPGIQYSLLEPASVYHTNIIGTQAMLDFAIRGDIRRFIFASSSSVYGNNSQLPLKEHYRPRPITPYALSKLTGEEAGRIYSELYGLHFIALRLFTVYGPSQRPDLAIHRFVKAVVNNQAIPCFGDGSSSRDYTYVNDVVVAIIAATNHEAVGFEMFNIGSNDTISLLELIKTIEEVTNTRANILWHKERPGDVLHTYADIGEARQRLSYSPSTSLKQGLTSFYEWFRKNQTVLCRMA